MVFTAIPNPPVPDLVDGRNRAIGGNLRQYLSSQGKKMADTVRALALAHTIAAPAYGATVQLDLSQGGIHHVQATDGNNFTIAAPKNPTQLATWTLSVDNQSGGAMGTVTFDSSIQQTGFTAPGAGQRTTASFYISGATHYQKSPWVTV